MSTITATALQTSYPSVADSTPLSGLIIADALLQPNYTERLLRESTSKNSTLPSLQLYLWNERDTARGRSIGGRTTKTLGGTLRTTWNA